MSWRRCYRELSRTYRSFVSRKCAEKHIFRWLNKLTGSLFVASCKSSSRSSGKFVFPTDSPGCVKQKLAYSAGTLFAHGQRRGFNCFRMITGNRLLSARAFIRARSRGELAVIAPRRQVIPRRCLGEFYCFTAIAASTALTAHCPHYRKSSRVIFAPLRLFRVTPRGNFGVHFYI